MKGRCPRPLDDEGISDFDIAFTIKKPHRDFRLLEEELQGKSRIMTNDFSKKTGIQSNYV